MDNKRLKTKGELMVEKAENRFWAYDTDNKGTREELILLDNVQFIYELSLAELELNALGIDFKVTNGLREFKILNKSPENKDLIKRKTSYFKSIDGELTDYYHIIQRNQTRSVNQYLTHYKENKKVIIWN